MHLVVVPIGLFMATITVGPRLGGDLRKRTDLIGDDLDALLADFQPALDEDRVVRAELFPALTVDIRPSDHFDEARLIFQVKATVTLALFCVPQSQSRDDAGQLDFARGGF